MKAQELFKIRTKAPFEYSLKTACKIYLGRILIVIGAFLLILLLFSSYVVLPIFVLGVMAIFVGKRVYVFFSRKQALLNKAKDVDLYSRPSPYPKDYCRLSSEEESGKIRDIFTRIIKRESKTDDLTARIQDIFAVEDPTTTYKIEAEEIIDFFLRTKNNPTAEEIIDFFLRTKNNPTNEEIIDFFLRIKKNPTGEEIADFIATMSELGDRRLTRANHHVKANGTDGGKNSD